MKTAHKLLTLKCESCIIWVVSSHCLNIGGIQIWQILENAAIHIRLGLAAV